MLPDSEDEGVIDSQLRALRLGDVKIMTLSMGCRMPQQKFVWRILARMDDRQREGQRMWIIFDGVHEASLSRIDLECSLSLVAGKKSLDDIAFLAANPFCLREGTLGDGVPAFEDVAVGVAGVGSCFDFRDAFDVGGDGEVDVEEFEIFEAEKAGIIVEHLEIVLEVGRAGAGQRHKDVRTDWWADMLLLGKGGNVGIAAFHGSSQEPPAFCNLRSCAGVLRPFWICGAG